jgi:hypothetical protein
MQMHGTWYKVEELAKNAATLIFPVETSREHPTMPTIMVKKALLIL